MGTLVRVAGPVHRDYRYLLPPGSSGRLLTPYPDPELSEDAAGDEDDATYIQWAWTRNISVGGGNTLFVALGTPATAVPETAESITGVTMYVRASYVTTRSEANQAGSGLEVGLSHQILSGEFDVETVWDLYSSTSTDDPFPLVADAVVREHSYTWDLADLQENDPEFTWEQLRTGVAAGEVYGQFWFHHATVVNESARTDTLRIHEAWFEINGLEPEITGSAPEVRRRFVYGHTR